MKLAVTYLDEENEPVVFTNNILGNYFSEIFFGNFIAQESPFLADFVTSQIENYSKTDSSKCINIVDTPIIKIDYLFWTLYFDGSKSNDCAGDGCILISHDGEKTMIPCRLEF